MTLGPSSPAISSPVNWKQRKASSCIRTSVRKASKPLLLRPNGDWRRLAEIITFGYALPSLLYACSFEVRIAYNI